MTGSEGSGWGVRGYQTGGERLSPDADSDKAEVGVGRSPLPHAGAADQCPQRIGVGVTPRQQGTLCGSGFGDGVAQPTQVSEIAEAIGVDAAALPAGSSGERCQPPSRPAS